MPSRLFLSSGDLMADRRFDFARDLQLKGDLAAAADLLLQATELAPGFASAWFTLGEIREQLGEREAAIAAFRKALERRSRRPPRRRPAADAARRRTDLSGMPPTYVRTLFDQYAPKFESGVGRTISAIAGRRCCSRRCSPPAPRSENPPASGAPSISAAAPGWPPRAFAAQVDHFTGIDLSPRMIERARATGLYAELEVADMLEGLRGRPDASARSRSSPPTRWSMCGHHAAAARGQARAGRRRAAGLHRRNPSRRRRHPRRGSALCPRRSEYVRGSSARPVSRCRGWTVGPRRGQRAGAGPGRGRSEEL